MTIMFALLSDLMNSDVRWRRRGRRLTSGCRCCQLSAVSGNLLAICHQQGKFRGARRHSGAAQTHGQTGIGRVSGF